MPQVHGLFRALFCSSDAGNRKCVSRDVVIIAYLRTLAQQYKRAEWRMKLSKEDKNTDPYSGPVCSFVQYKGMCPAVKSRSRSV